MFGLNVELESRPRLEVAVTPQVVALVDGRVAVELDVVLRQPVRPGECFTAGGTCEGFVVHGVEVLSHRLVFVKGFFASRRGAGEGLGVDDLVALEMLGRIDAFSANGAMEGFTGQLLMGNCVRLQVGLAQKALAASRLRTRERSLSGVGPSVLF